MKHIFVIHSNTVLLTALGVIDYEHLKHKDIVFLYGRNFTSSIVDSDIECHDISDIYYVSPSLLDLTLKSKVKSLNSMIDESIGKCLNCDFIVYLPHTGVYLFQMLMTYCKCKGVSLLQEGAFSYFTKPINNPFKTKVKNFLFSTNRFWFQINWNIPNFVYKYFTPYKTYALNKAFFAPLSNHFDNVVIKWPLFDGDQFILSEGSSVFLFDNAVELGFVEKDIYLEGCKKLVNNCKYNKCYVKFHPSQTQTTIDELLKLFEGREICYCDKTIPFEIVMSCSKNLSLYGFGTSLLKFGKDLGHNIICGVDDLCAKSSQYKNYINSQL